MMIILRLQHPGAQNARKLAKVVAPIFLAVLLLLLLGFFFMPKAAAVPPPAPLSVPGNPVTHPVSNTHTAPPTTTVSITYDEDIDRATVSTRTFAVHAMQTGLLTQAYGVDGGTISLTPTRPFKPGELVQVSATTGTLNASGQGPVSPTVWQFWAAVTGGSGVFTDSSQRLGISNTYGVALGDLDGDGDLDAFVANDGANQVWRNDGTGIFTDTRQTLGISNTYDVALGDLDGDGDLDAFVANMDQANQVWLNDGTGEFYDSGQRLGSSGSWAVALGDVDGNGALDAVVANGISTNTVWLNGGTGYFGENPQRLGKSASRDIELGDIDGDGDLDAFVANWGYNEVWLNDGAGSFEDSGQRLGNPGNLDSWAVALGDVDGDGNLDAFVANLGPDEIWLNDRAGKFDDSGQSLGSSGSWAVALGDMDGDGDLDAFIANVEANKVWLNDGGSFVDSRQRLGSSASGTVGLPWLQQWSRGTGHARLGGSVSSDVTLGDVNGDGALDAFVANSANQANTVWLQVLHPAIRFNKTVGPEKGLCATADSVGVTPGSQVFYCYRATNTGNVALTTHTLTDSELTTIFSGSHTLLPGATWFVTKAATLAQTTVNSAVWTASADDYVAVATDTATVGVITPAVQINQILPNPSWFLENVLFEGSGKPTAITEFIDEYEWTWIPVSATCGSYSTPTLLGTAARIEDNTIPVGTHRICLRGGVYTNTTSSGSYTMTWSHYDTTTMTVRKDRRAYSDIAVGPKSVSFWADPSARDSPVYNPKVGETVQVKVEVHNISVHDTPDEVTVFFYDGPITASLHGPIEGTLVGTNTIDFIKHQTSEFVTIPWTIGGEEGYRPFAVDIEYTDNISYFAHLPLPPHPESHFESDYKNNRTTGAIPIGHITGTYGISVTGDVVPIRQPRLYAGYPAYVSGRANYVWDVQLATMGATTTIRISNVSGAAVTCWETYQTWTRSPDGRYGITIRLPDRPGVYRATVVVDDGNLMGALAGDQAITFTVSEPPPPLPDLYVERFSVLLSGPNTYIRTWQDYTFHRVYNRSMLFGVQNKPITITARVHNGGTLSVNDPFTVSFYDGPPGDGGTLIGTEILTGLARGTWEEVTHAWTPTRTGIHAIQVVVDEANEITEYDEINNYDRYYYWYQFCFNRITGNCHRAAHRDVIDVRASKPDLRALGLNYVEPVISETITMTVNVHNIGHADISETEAFTFTAYDGYPNIGLASTRMLTAPRVSGPMNQGTHQTFDVVWNTGYTGTVEGWHHICVEVDTGDEIDEELEENNVNCWDLYVFPEEADLYPYRLTYSNNSPLPDEEIEITAWFENRGGEAFTETADVSFYHTSITPTNWITTTKIVGPIPGRRGIGTTHPITWKTLSSHGTTYIYVLYIKESGDYNRGPRPYAQRLNIRKKPPPDLHVLSKDIHLSSTSPASGEQVSVTADIANVSHSPIATATNFIVEFHTSGPTAGYNELGHIQTIASLEPGGTTTVQASEPFTMADKFYAVQVSAWPRVQQGDEDYSNNEATTSVKMKGVVVLNLATTVGTEAGVCADTDVTTVTYGKPVFYCYRMTNQSSVHLSTHDLSDAKLGDVVSGYAYDLSPGETFVWVEPAVLTQTTRSTATWTAFTSPYVFTATDVTTVNVRHLIYLPLVLKGSPN
jgi:hypothetical protein